MSISSVSHSSTTTSSSSRAINPNDYEFNPKPFIFLIPTITAVALGILFVPNFGLGLTAGAVMLVATVVVMSVLKKIGLIPEVKEKSSEYSKHVEKNRLAVALFGPIAEEAVFRGGLQPLLTHTIQLILPAAATVFFAPALSVAATVSLVATGIIFGAVHYLNPHKNAFSQAVSASLVGIGYGLLYAHFGIAAPVAAHIANNTIVSLILLPKSGLKLKSCAEDPKIEEHIHKKLKRIPIPA